MEAYKRALRAVAELIVDAKRSPCPRATMRAEAMRALFLTLHPLRDASSLDDLAVHARAMQSRVRVGVFDVN